MKIPYDIINELPKPLIEIACFAMAVVAGTIYKLIKQNEKGIKITIKKIFTEGFVSLFIAVIVWSVFDQWLHFKPFFTYSMCSLAGSMSSVFHAKIEDFIGFLFDAAKQFINNKFNLKGKNEKA